MTFNQILQKNEHRNKKGQGCSQMKHAIELDKTCTIFFKNNNCVVK